MSVVKINAIEVPEGAGPELESRFAARAGAVENAPGFQYFQLLRPVKGESRYFVVTWWEDEESFQGWMNSQDFARGHAAAGSSGAPGGAHGAEGHGPDGASAEGASAEGDGAEGDGAEGDRGSRPPVSTGASLLSFEVVEQTGPAGG